MDGAWGGMDWEGGFWDVLGRGGERGMGMGLGGDGVGRWWGWGGMGRDGERVVGIDKNMRVNRKNIYWWLKELTLKVRKNESFRYSKNIEIYESRNLY